MSENPQDKEPKPPFDEQEKVAPPGYEAQKNLIKVRAN